ncbi:MFS transporter [Caulobacter mirabilis]|nr:MFS transporter [Caulobacter mirabilis]
MTLAAFAAPCLPLAAFGLPLVITLPHYYSETLGLSLSAVAAAFFFVRIIDIGFDPLFGMVLDRTRWSFGRFKGWMAISAPMLVAAIYMLFFAKQGVGPVYLWFWLIVVYFGYSIAVLSHTSWAAKLSTDYHQRSRIYAWWQSGNVIGMIMILTLPVVLNRLGVGGNETEILHGQGWFIVILLPIMMGLALWRVPEDKPTGAATDHNASLGDYFALLKRPSVIRILAADLLSNVGPGIAGILFFFYFTRVKDFTFLEASSLLLFYFLAAIFGAAIWTRLARRIGKSKTLIAACVTYAIVQFAVVTLPSGNFWLAVPFLLLAGIPFSAGPLLLRSMMADYADEERLATGKDRTGLLYAILTGTVKVGTATASVSLFVLDALGFDAKVAANSTEISMQGLQALYALAPGIIGLLAAATLIGYPLTEEKHAEILRKLEERDGTPQPPVPEDVAVAQPVSTQVIP